MVEDGGEDGEDETDVFTDLEALFKKGHAKWRRGAQFKMRKRCDE